MGSPANARSRLTESDILEHAYGIPSLPLHAQTQHGATASAKDNKPSSRAGSSQGGGGGGHGRSMSHPFPSLFSGKKKRSEETTGTAAAAVGGGAFDSTDDESSSSPLKQKVADKDLKTGKCMTCDSMVRWPKELKVFRCTVCLTINDLKAVVLEVRDGHRIPVKSNTGGGGGGGFFGQSSVPVKGKINLRP